MADDKRRKEIAEAVRLIRKALEDLGEVKQAQAMDEIVAPTVPQRETGETIH